MWTRLSSRVVFAHPRLTLVEDEVALPGGVVVRYLRVPSGGFGVTLLCRRADGAVLLQREYSYPPNARLLQLPGGGGRPGETMASLARRFESGRTPESSCPIRATVPPLRGPGSCAELDWERGAQYAWVIAGGDARHLCCAGPPLAFLL